MDYVDTMENIKIEYNQIYKKRIRREAVQNIIFLILIIFVGMIFGMITFGFYHHVSQILSFVIGVIPLTCWFIFMFNIFQVTPKLLWESLPIKSYVVNENQINGLRLSELIQKSGNFVEVSKGGVFFKHNTELNSATTLMTIKYSEIKLEQIQLFDEYITQNFVGRIQYNPETLSDLLNERVSLIEVMKANFMVVFAILFSAICSIVSIPIELGLGLFRISIPVLRISITVLTSIGILAIPLVILGLLVLFVRWVWYL